MIDKTEDEPIPITMGLIMKVGFMIFLVVFSFFMWRIGRLYGGKEACINSDSQLGEAFSCEFPEALEDTEDFAKLGWVNIPNGTKEIP